MKRKERSMSLRQIAKELGLSLNTVSVEQRHALAKLKKLEEGGMSRAQIMELIRLR